jgi:hypothetical protein
MQAALYSKAFLHKHAGQLYRPATASISFSLEDLCKLRAVLINDIAKGNQNGKAMFLTCPGAMVLRRRRLVCVPAISLSSSLKSESSKSAV